MMIGFCELLPSVLIVVAFVSNVESLQIRLVGGKHHYEGKIEVLYRRKWGEICDHFWGTRDAQVACRMLGYPGVERFTFGDWWGRGHGYFWLDDVQCQGNERSLVQCKHKGWGRCNCRRGEVAGVVCKEADEKRVILPTPFNSSLGLRDLPVRLIGGPVVREIISAGTLQVQVNGKWGLVCVEGWTDFNSRVACGMLGYKGAIRIPIKPRNNGLTNYTYFMTNVKCSGIESSLMECEHNGWGPHTCSEGFAVSLVCRRSAMFKHPLVRLRGSYLPWEGRVEVKSFNRREKFHWGTVCDDRFGLVDANVVCRTLGLGTASRVFTNAKFGQGVRRIYMDDVHCRGWEKNLHECSYKKKSNCNHYEDVGVRCNAPTLHTNKIRLTHGRSKYEGYVEMHDGKKWGAVCADNWSIEEASVVCRHLNLGFAQKAVSGRFDFRSSKIQIEYSNVDCSLHELSLYHCSRDHPKKTRCSGPLRAGVYCTQALPDLVVNVEELENHVRIDAIPLSYLRCSYEENCLAASARTRWHDNRHEIRRLLRFTTRIENRGLASFIPDNPRSQWQWHQCHAHYHSMEVFSTYDLVDKNGMKISAGHKASFCLEDTVCDPGIERWFNCTDGGQQGVSKNCYDVYKWTIDCQWIDVTDIPYGEFYLRVVVNPQRKVAESDYMNNIAKCELSDYGNFAAASNCRLESCESGVDTHGGNANGGCCIFPFKYQNRWYRSCTKVGSRTFFWCATTRNFDKDNTWGICY